MNYATRISVQEPPEPRSTGKDRQRAGLPSVFDPSQLGASAPASTATREPVFSIGNLTAYYGPTPAVRDVTFDIYRNMVTAIIGPSGCGKSTFIRCLNRMNDGIRGFRTEGSILYHDVDLQGSSKGSSAGLAEHAPSGDHVSGGITDPDTAEVDDRTEPAILNEQVGSQ